MKITPLQRKVFEVYQKLRISPPTAFRLLRMNWVCYAPLIILAILLVPAMVLINDEPSLGSVLIGVTGGVILRDFQHFKITTKFWPALSHVIDWEKIDDALSGREDWS